MNIAFCKLGKSIKFKGNYSPIGGDCEAPLVIRALANNNPSVTFYLAGKSDYGRLSDIEKYDLFPYGNVINVYEHIEVKSMQTRACYKDPYIQCLHTYFTSNNIYLDSVIMMMGQVGGVSVPGKTWQVKDTSLVASCIDMTANYTSPITVWLNENRLGDGRNIPIIEIINDPRYTLAQPRDITFNPDTCLSQFDYSYTNYTIKNYEEQLPKIPHECKVTYNGMEKAFLIGRAHPTSFNNERNSKFTVILNEGKPSRYNLLKEWILTNDELQEDLKIYGKWDEKHTINDSRFKGSIHLDAVQKIMEDTRYTFIIPIKDGWVTSKYIEMIYAGVIPFFHPSYDTQGHINLSDGDVDFNKLLRPKTPADLINTINELESKPITRKFVIRKLQEMLIKPKDLTGESISTEIMTNSARLNNNTYERQPLNSFNKIDEPKQTLTLESLY
jgi:hypothetical protein